MSVAICDVNEAKVTTAAELLAEEHAAMLAGKHKHPQRIDASIEAAGKSVLGLGVDVSDEAQVQAFAQAVRESFPGLPVSLLCCNAGVGGGGPVLGAEAGDWAHVMGVNVGGVRNFIRAFVPDMLARGKAASGGAPAGSVVTTASQDGLCAAQGVYGVSKHACVALTVALYQEVRGRVTVHTLCPNLVATSIPSSDPRAAAGARPGSRRAEANAEVQARVTRMGMLPSRCAELVFDAIQSGDFYVLAEHEEDPGYVRRQVETRMDAILNRGHPRRPVSELLSATFDLRNPLPAKKAARL